LVENSSTACPEAISKLADSFFFLEMELKVTRDRLRDLRAIVDTAPEENLRNAIRALADALEENIEQDLSRLFIINRQQLDIGLTDSVPYLNDGFERPQRRSVPVHCPPAPEPQSQDADTRAYERPDSDDSNGMAFQEWIRVCKEPDWGRVGDLRSPPSLASYGRYG
jgi:hypothetical protein